MADLLWLPDEHWAVVNRFMPTNQLGARRVDDPRIVSGILHMLRTGGLWLNVREDNGPAATVYDRIQKVVTMRFLARHPGRSGRGGLDRSDFGSGQHPHHF